MKNTFAIAAFIKASENTDDHLNSTACRRAAVWLKWCDGFGATLTDDEAERISNNQSLAETARLLIARLAQDFPNPPEDASLRYLDDEDETRWMKLIPKKIGTKDNAAEIDDGRAISPFASISDYY